MVKSRINYTVKSPNKIGGLTSKYDYDSDTSDSDDESSDDISITTDSTNIINLTIKNLKSILRNIYISNNMIEQSENRLFGPRVTGIDDEKSKEPSTLSPVEELSTLLEKIDRASKYNVSLVKNFTERF